MVGGKADSRWGDGIARGFVERWFGGTRRDLLWSPAWEKLRVSPLRRTRSCPAPVEMTDLGLVGNETRWSGGRGRGG